MKTLILIFGFFLSLSQSFAQTASNVVDTSEHPITVTFREPNLNDKADLIVIDGKEFTGRQVDEAFKNLNPDNIFRVSILKGDSAKAIYGGKWKNGVAIIITRQYAASQYQKKLIQFSPQYKDYLKLYKNDDSGLIYLLNGTVLDRGMPQVQRILYGLIERIKTVYFIEKFSEKLNLNNPKPIVVITTLQ